MKENFIRKWFRASCPVFVAATTLALLLSLMAFLNVSSHAQNAGAPDYEITPDDIIVAVRADNLIVFDVALSNWLGERGRFNNELLGIFKDPKSSNLSRSASAYYLGDQHVLEAVDPLATDITLQPIILSQEEISPLHGLVAVDALVKIGTPSIPAMIRNLEQSDDYVVRILSLRVIYRIEGDKDIVQMRLEKALVTQSDSKKKARLQSAIHALSDPKVSG